MTPPTPREFEVLLDALLEDRVEAHKGDPTTHWQKTRAYLIDAYSAEWQDEGEE